MRQNLYNSDMLNIESYNLYGERDDFPDVLHCETIETRSLHHDWEFKPHRHMHLHQFLLLNSGGADAVVEEEKSVLTPGTMMTIPAGVVHGFSFEPQSKGWVVTLTAELLEQGLLNTEGLRPLLRRPNIVSYGADVERIVLAIFAEFSGRSFARAHVLRALSGVLSGLVARAISDRAPAMATRQRALQIRFEALLEEHFLQHWTVSDYASALGVTSTHLSRVMRQAVGQSAQAAIEGRVMLEARRKLAFSNLRVAEVAYQLGFDDPAYFSRVVKRATGLSPRDFRQSLGA